MLDVIGVNRTIYFLSRMIYDFCINHFSFSMTLRLSQAAFSNIENRTSANIMRWCEDIWKWQKLCSTHCNFHSDTFVLLMEKKLLFSLSLSFFLSLKHKVTSCQAHRPTLPTNPGSALPSLIPVGSLGKRRGRLRVLVLFNICAVSSDEAFSNATAACRIIDTTI